MTTPVNKFHTALAISALALASLVSAPRAHAQRPVVQATVPFDFEYGNAHMKAGKYNISLQTNEVMELQSRPSSAFGMVQWSETSHPTATGKLVFHRYGDVYLLKEVWLPGSVEHARLPRSKAERVLEEISQNQPRTDSNIEVALVESPR